MSTQRSLQFTEAMDEQDKYLKRCGFGNRTNIVRISVGEKYDKERKERGDIMSDEMTTIRVKVGSVETAHNGFTQDDRQVVEFIGRELGQRTTYDYDVDRGCLSDTRGCTATLFRTEDGRLIVHTDNWSRWQGDPSTEILREIQEDDLHNGGEYERLGAECGFGQPLSLDEALVG